MPETYTSNQILNAIAFASKSLSERKDEVNRLNVFPVPDGDTGTNMSLTIQSVVDNLAALPIGASSADIRKTITTGALMGARGNSGVITSQILRGLCEGVGEHEGEGFTVAMLDHALASAQATAFSAVRKPVEGTILTVLKDTAAAAKRANKKKMDLDEALTFISSEAYASVQRTPDLLDILKENGVVDAGGFGFAILLDSFVSALQGREQMLGDELALSRTAEPKVEIEQINDWEGSAYRYCNEFLVDSDTLVPEEALEFLATMGDCELCVGATPKFKVHVHSNTPDKVLAYFLERGQVSEVFIHNMQLQSAARTQALAAEAAPAKAQKAAKPLGFVAVAAGQGNAAILESLGVDVVVSGGQTMNPSTKDLLDAVERTGANEVIILPDNPNIIMAANSAAEVAESPVAVVPTRRVPEAFAAMFAADMQSSLADNASTMAEAIKEVRTGEVTQAIKDSHDALGNPIAEGDIIGIADGAILAVGKGIEEVTLALLQAMEAGDSDTLTLLAGADYDDAAFEALSAQIEEAYDELEVDAHRGDQPLYPIIFSLE